MTRMLLTLACAALLFAFAEARAAEPGTKPAPVAKPEAGKGEGTNPEEAKPEATTDEGSEATSPRTVRRPRNPGALKRNPRETAGLCRSANSPRTDS